MGRTIDYGKSNVRILILSVAWKVYFSHIGLSMFYALVGDFEFNG